MILGPSTIAGAHRAIKARLVAIAAAFWSLSTKTEAQRVPRVHDGWLPPKTPEGEDFPFMVLRPRTGTDSVQAGDQTADATFEIVIGTYSDEDDGWLDVALIIDAIRLSFASDPVIDGAIEHVGPLTWAINQEQPRPQWLGGVTAIFRLPRAERVAALNPQE